MLFLIKNSVSWARSPLLHGILHGILQIVQNTFCKFAIKRQFNAFVAKMTNTQLTKISRAIFVLAERMPNSATLYVSLSFVRIGKIADIIVLRKYRELFDSSVPQNS